jgi:hypothetical protein
MGNEKWMAIGAKKPDPGWQPDLFTRPDRARQAGIGPMQKGGKRLN